MISRSHGLAPEARNARAARTVRGVWWNAPREGQLLVVQAVRVDGHLSAAEEDDGAAGPDEVDRVAPGLRRADRLDHDVGSAAVARHRAEERRQRAPLRPPADHHRPCARVGHARAEHISPIGPAPRIATVCPGSIPARSRRRAGSTRAAP